MNDRSPLRYLPDIKKRQGLDHISGFLELNREMHNPEFTRTAVFVVNATESDIRCGEYDFTDQFSQQVNAARYTDGNDTMLIHGFQYERISEDDRLPLTRMRVHYVLSESLERKQINRFIKALNQLQTDHGITIGPESPMFNFQIGGGCAPYSFMNRTGNQVTISRPWGG